MDGITLYDTMLFYSLLFSPLLAMILISFWMSANSKNKAKVQLLGIVILVVLGFFAINSPFIIIIELTAIFLFLAWIYTHREFFLEERLSVFLSIVSLQLAYYSLFIFLMSLGNLAIALLCFFPILSLVLLYSWTFGRKKASRGRVYIIMVSIVQVILLILTIILSFTAYQ